MTSNRRRLGRGLDALLGPTEATATAEDDDTQSSKTENLVELPLDLLQRGRYQPRREIDPAGLEELAESIRSQGVMQPIVARPLDSGRYEIIAGERRWRAAQMAGLETLPAIVRDIPDEAAIAIALIENIQRENLNPIEEAGALQRLMDEFGLSQQRVAEAVGKSRTTITNLLRLLRLAPEVREFLERGDMEMGHARALLTLPFEQQLAVARQIVQRGLSVRQAEQLVRRAQSAGGEQSAGDGGGGASADTRALEQQLSERLGAPVAIQHSARGAGRLVIRYASLDELDGILHHLR